ncbi:putative receptor-like protein kinase [Vitis vinifera]|uniref:Putative receptor-like protein kinase n=1 Tax=Vitis vinifera TaxID=29760 RepID=A0A438EIE6_VITVI|nr:putative receptor-like protein kinase [Vitis vinifera]
MEDKKASIIAVSSVVALIILIIVARVSLKLSNTFFLILGADIAAILAIFTYVIIRWRFNRRRKLLETRLVSEGRELRIEYSFLRKVAGVPTKFRYKELEEATDNFQALIGRGASASVFRGILNDGTSVAVKRIEGEEHGEKEFKSEVAAIASVQHVPVLHLDVKPENILLDENYRALVSDFGLSKLMRKDESRVLTTIRGTRGYLAPEWLLEHGVSEKSDIYSYGMVLFEMLGGQRNVCLIENGNDRSQRKWQYFPKVVTEKMREGKLMEVVDHRLVEGGGIDEREVKRLVYVALWCIQEKARLRPTMARVVEMLEGHVTVDEPPETQMIIVDLLCTDEEPANACNRPRMAALVTPQVDNATLPSTSTYSYALSVLSGR